MYRHYIAVIKRSAARVTVAPALMLSAAYDKMQRIPLIIRGFAVWDIDLIFGNFSEFISRKKLQVSSRVCRVL